MEFRKPEPISSDTELISRLHKMLKDLISRQLPTNYANIIVNSNSYLEIQSIFDGYF